MNIITTPKAAAAAPLATLLCSLLSEGCLSNATDDNGKPLWPKGSLAAGLFSTLWLNIVNGGAYQWTATYATWRGIAWRRTNNPETGGGSYWQAFAIWQGDDYRPGAGYRLLPDAIENAERAGYKAAEFSLKPLTALGMFCHDLGIPNGPRISKVEADYQVWVPYRGKGRPAYLPPHAQRGQRGSEQPGEKASVGCVKPEAQATLDRLLGR